MQTAVALVGVIPAAGFALRLQPLPCSKEVYPIEGKPVMDYLVERMRLAQADEIRVVTRPEKTDVIERARAYGAIVVETYPPSPAASFVAGMRGLGDSDVVLMGFPDTVWQPEHGFLLLLDEVRAGYDLVLGVFPGHDPERSDVVEVAPDGTVTSVEVKPRSPRSRWIWGCAAGRARLLWGMERDGEPGIYFGRLAATERIKGVKLSDFIDIGTKSALAEVAR